MRILAAFLPALLLAGVMALPAHVQSPTPQPPAPGLTPRAEEAIDRGLGYLAARQARDGGWGRNHTVANTSLALLAFLARGHMPEKPPHGDALARGIDFLLREAQAGGGYLGKSMYEHGLATLALSEVWGMSSRGDEIRAALKLAVGVILRSQSPQGGWRYNPRPTDADVSVTVMQVVALASAREAGLLVPDETIQKAVRYVKGCQTRSGGFGYRGPAGPGFARTAAGVVSLQMAGEKASPEVRDGLDYLLAAPASKFRELPDSQWYYYGHYYAAVAFFQAGEEDFGRWYPHIRDALLARQNADGSFRGEDYGTPMALLILSMPCRFLPIYQR